MCLRVLRSCAAAVLLRFSEAFEKAEIPMRYAMVWHPLFDSDLLHIWLQKHHHVPFLTSAPESFERDTG